MTKIRIRRREASLRSESVRRVPRCLDAGVGSIASNACSALRRSSRPRTATSAPRSTTRSGLTAVYALGLTPLVFVIAGIIFAATAATYAEGTVRYPEAGGSSSFARHAFNELVSFGAAWAQMLVYIVTVATSAFFVPHYLSVFWEPLRENPADIVGGAIVIVVLVALNIVGVQEAAKLSVTLAVVDFATQVLLVILGFILVFSPEVIADNIHWGVAPTWSQFAIAIPVAMLAYTGVETVSNLAEEARDPARTVPAAYKWVAGAVFAIYFTLPLVALSAMPVQMIDGELTTLLALPPEEGGYANDPILGVVDNLGVTGLALDGLQIYVGILAATILIVATNAGVIGASRITYSMATYRQMPERLPAAPPALQDAVAVARRLRGRGADPRHPARGHDVRRHAVLVRRDAVVHGRPRLDREAAHEAGGRGGAVPGAPEPPAGRRRLAALRRARRARHRHLASSSSSSRTRRRAGSGSPGWWPGSSATSSTAGGWSTCRLSETVKAPPAFGPAIALEYRTIVVPLVAGEQAREAMHMAAATCSRAAVDDRRHARDRRAARPARSMPSSPSRRRSPTSCWTRRTTSATSTASASSSASSAVATPAPRSSRKPSGGTRRSSSWARRGCLTARARARSSARRPTTCSATRPAA